MKWLQKLKSKTAAVFSVFSAFALTSLFGSQAFAALQADVVTALETAKTDVGQAGGLVLIALVVAAAYRYIRRAL